MHDVENCMETKSGSAQSSPSSESAPQSRTPSFHLKTLWLFTKSDIKTVVIPQIIFAVAGTLSGPAMTAVDTRPRFAEVAWHLPHTILWIWLHLLVENIANQRLAGSIVEDASNKPWRPLPSQRLSPAEAQRLLLAVIPVAVGTSALAGVFTPSVTMMTLVWMYNDLEGSGINVWVRNLLNAVGLNCFSWAATVVLAGAPLTPIAYVWLAITGAVIFTTVHAQDFPDVEGDRARGRQTIPLLYPEGPVRGLLAATVLVWSVACPAFWSAAPVGWALMGGIGSAMAVLTLFWRGQRADEAAWKLWCLWMTVLYLMPAFGTT